MCIRDRHVPRGWPFPVLGEWDILLTAHAVAAGAPPPAVLGAVQGSDLGTYLVALTAAIPIALGVDPDLAGKLVAMGFGASIAGLCAAWAASLAGRGLEGEADSRTAVRASWTAGVITTVLLACAWPGLHFDLAGLNGRSVEAALPQLLALLLVLDLRRGAGPAAACAAGPVSYTHLTLPTKA